MTLKWRQRKQGWSRTSTSCPMPIQVPPRGGHPFCRSSALRCCPLHQCPEVAPAHALQWHQAPEQQAEALVAAGLAILRKNLAQPFSLTLLNIGATNFSAAASAQHSVMPQSFARLLSRDALPGPAAAAQDASSGARPGRGTAALLAVTCCPRDRGDGACCCQAGEPGAHSRAAAVAAIAHRRDYGAAPQGVPLSKADERRLNERGRFAESACPLQQDVPEDYDDWNAPEEGVEGGHVAAARSQPAIGQGAVLTDKAAQPCPSANNQILHRSASEPTSAIAAALPCAGAEETLSTYKLRSADGFAVRSSCCKESRLGIGTSNVEGSLGSMHSNTARGEQHAAGAQEAEAHV